MVVGGIRVDDSVAPRGEVATRQEAIHGVLVGGALGNKGSGALSNATGTRWFCGGSGSSGRRHALVPSFSLDRSRMKPSGARKLILQQHGKGTALELEYR